MKVINLTPHNVVYQAADGSRLTFPSVGKEKTARVDSIPGQKMIQNFEGNDVDVYTSPSYGDVYNLPEHQEGTVYIVSFIVAQHPAVRGRKDVVVPGTGPRDGAIRYPEGHKLAGLIEAVTRFNQA